MKPSWTETEAVELMDEAFSADSQAPVQEKLQELLKKQPEFQSLWEEYLKVRTGLAQLQARTLPTETGLARIRKAARNRLKNQSTPNKHPWWRHLISQPMVAVATVCLMLGFGIYSQIWWQDNRGHQPVTPALESELKNTGDGEKDRDAEEATVPKKSLISQPVDTDIKAKKPVRKKRAKSKISLPPPASKPAPSGGAKQDSSKQVLAAPKGALSTTTEGKQAPARASQVKPGLGRKQLSVPALSNRPQQEPRSRDKQKVKKMTPEEKAPSDKLEEQGVIGHSAEKNNHPETKGLIFQAKAKMEMGQYNAALEKLLAAQKIKDSPEIRRLIAQCRAEIRLIEEK